MEIKGKVHCFFEQSGTFKNEFKKLGINALDYDIQNNFGETDHIMDLFEEIDRAYDNLTRQDKTRQDKTLFDEIDPYQDLIVAFYPCIYFCEKSQMSFCLSMTNYRALKDDEKILKIIERTEKRKEFYERLLKFIYIVIKKNIRMVFENPWTPPHYLMNNFLKPPTIVDKNRMERGDFFKKPTAYWFWNCEPTYGFTYQNDKKQKIIENCKLERSLLSSDYARNWICDFIIGKTQNIRQLYFNFEG